MADSGRISGLIVFIFGVALLAFAYFIGYMLLIDVDKLAKYSELIPIPQLEVLREAGPLASAVAPIIKFASYIVPIIILLVMIYAASKITYYGIQVWRSEPRVEKAVKETLKKKEASPSLEG